VSRPLVWTLYAACVLVWSSTWVVIAVGLEDIAPFFGAGIRFALAGLGLLVVAAATGRSLRTDFVLSATVGLLPFATTYGLIYWAEQYVTSGLTSVLFGVLPLYVALLAAATLPSEPLRPRLIGGVGIALGGLIVAFSESLDLGSGEHTALAALAVILSPLASAIGNVAIKKRGATLDPLVMNGWAMLCGGLVLLALSGATEDWGATIWSATSVGSILYLAAFGTSFTFVTLTVLLRELPAVTVSFISMIIPFGALALGALVRDEEVTALAVGGALLVVAGIAVAQLPVRRRVPA
jgi:drug/metabolite transporter (DMT)-like permease